VFTCVAVRVYNDIDDAWYTVVFIFKSKISYEKFCALQFTFFANLTAY